MPRASINCKDILRLRENRMSQDSIASAIHASKKSVSNVLKSAKALSIGYADVKDMTDEDIHALLFPEQEEAKQQHCYPDLIRLHESLAYPGTTLMDEWHTFGNACIRKGRGAVGYSTFCNAYNAYIAKEALPSHAVYKYGDMLLCTWVGGAFPVPDTKLDAYIFLGVLPASGRVYTEVTDAKDEDTFIRCIVHMFSNMDGTTRTIGIAHAREPGARRMGIQDVLVSDRTLGLRRHYGINVSPLPQNSVIDALSGSLAKDLSFSGSVSLQAVITRSEKWMSAINTSNGEQFDKEKSFLIELSVPDYDVTTKHKKELTVLKNSHVKYQNNYYSVPYQFRGKAVRLQYTDKLVEILSEDCLIAVHDRLPPFSSHKYVTDGSHMPPPSKRPAMDKERMLTLSATMGPDVKAVADRMFRRVDYEEQAYNSVQSLLHLGKQFGPSKLNEACRKALDLRNSASYKYISELLKS